MNITNLPLGEVDYPGTGWLSIGSHHLCILREYSEVFFIELCTILGFILEGKGVAASKRTNFIYVVSGSSCTRRLLTSLFILYLVSFSSFLFF